ncbi:MAG: PD40 domain-containing protein, partial [Candidatus Aminicenantes bacterium]|nr:PD40 domain-containing protein [Candidatus Aminicenantes bacterium]
MKKIIYTFAFILCLIMLQPQLSAGETHSFSIHDMLAMDRISDPQVSPDGKWIVFNLRTTDLEANRGRTDLWLVGTDGNDLRRLTSNLATDYNARWSPCGRYIWFLSTRSGSSQVWKIRVGGGEAVQFTDLPLDAGNLLVSPDGKHIAFTLEVFPDNPTPKATRMRLDEIASCKSTGRLYENTFIRHWDTWKDGRRSNLFVMATEGGKYRNLMPGMDADTPSKPFGGPEEITFTPDGNGLVFTARNVGREEPWSTDFDLYYVPVDGSAAPKCLTEENEAWDTGPLFSPDGKIMAYLAMQRPRFEADRYRIVLYSWPSGETKILTENWDHSPSSLCWSPDSRFLYATAPNLGQVSLFAIDAATGKASTIIE